MDKSKVFSKNHSEIQALFEGVGGIFLWEISKIIKISKNIKSIILDWDGVFTDGRKDQNKNSTYSELDTMGLNMLRFGYWKLTKTVLPVFLVTGEENPTAWVVAERDRFSGVYFGVKNKSQIDKNILDNFDVDISQSLFFFDDILDLSLVRKCVLTIGIPNLAMPLFREQQIKEPNCCYLTGNGGEHHGIREACEMLLGLWGNYNFVVENRSFYTAEYKDFLNQRNKIKPQLF